jgi:hypothetical protein
MEEPPRVPDGSFTSGRKSDGAQVLDRRLAILWVGNNVESNLLPLIEAVHPSTFDLSHVHEDILTAIIWLDESVAFVWIELLHRALSHSPVFQVGPHWGAYQRG